MPAVYAWCTRRTPLAERVGAVNTFWTEADGLVGDNTDVGGFDFAVERLLGRRPEGIRVGMLGAGGAAAAVCAAVERWADSRVLLHARSRDRAEQLAARFAGVATCVDSELHTVEGTDLLVTATPLGLDPLTWRFPLCNVRRSTTQRHPRSSSDQPLTSRWAWARPWLTKCFKR